MFRKGVMVRYGPSLERLTEFGVQPFRGRKRKATSKKSSDAAEISSST